MFPRSNVGQARTAFGLCLALPLLLLGCGCNAGVQASATEAVHPIAAEASSGIDASATPDRSGADFEARWAHLAVHAGPERTAPQWNGAMDGPVTLWYPSGAKRGEGRYVDSNRVGPWTFWHENGQRRWQGTYVDGELDGSECAWFDDGERELECNWKDGERNGIYTQWHVNGRIAAQGEYKSGKREGRFDYFHVDGTVDDKLTGTYVRDRRVGD
ncbi:MAG: toxin-antitoxin system YwqK family antitoxin [Planctomycetes bacterium]|nr:toxin-antitoxin system YwqK family antitoxin [Planctomycetota bacterium]